MRISVLALSAALLSTVSLPAWAAEEFAIGEAAVQNNLVIQPHYLTGIEMSSMLKPMAMGPDSVHLEADVHAAKGETHGFAEGTWIPYLTIVYTIEKVDSKFKKTGTLLPMTAGDGPHYANSLELAGPGQYHLTYNFQPPAAKGFLRHVDKATGVPEWWKPFTMEWNFTYPIDKAK